MGVIVFLLCVGIISGIIVVMDIARHRHYVRCQQLKAYIKFLETSHLIEDAHDGVQWIEERASHRMICDIQDVTYN